MSSVADLLARLHAKGIKLWNNQGELCYSGPKGSMTPELKQALRERKAAILEFLAEPPPSAKAGPAPASTREPGPGPLCFAQQRLWFLAQLEGQSRAYMMPAAWRVTGRLEETPLRDALRALVERQAALRLCFPALDGKPVAELLPVYDPLEVRELADLPEAKRDSEVHRQMAAHAEAPFDLARGPLFRVLLLKLGSEAILQFNLHHIISDGWSMGVLLRDWSRLYRAGLRKQPPALDDLAFQYPDYARWQRTWLNDALIEKQFTYWREKLSGAKERLELPTDFPRPAVMSELGAHWSQTLAPELVRRIREFCREQNVTVFMTLLAAFKVLVGRTSGQTDLSVGSPVANRSLSQTENLVGLFANTLVFRTQLGEDDTFLGYLAQVKQSAIEAFDHQDLPFELLVERLNPARSLSHTPLFQVMFVLQKAPREAFALPGVNLEFLPLERPTAAFDLTLEVTDTGEALVCDWEYSRALFRPETIERMSGHFALLLDRLLAFPAERPARMSLLSDADHRQLAAWNQTQVPFPPVTVVDLFESQVAQTPEAIALVHGETSLTYAELNQRANRLAHTLAERGVRAETPVALCVERSPEMIVGLLGILKAGGAYLPLDPHYPAARLKYLLADAAAPLLLTQSHLRQRWAGAIFPEGKILCLDEDPGAGRPATNPVRQSGPGQLAYVIYTSGTSGAPKGVLIEHAALANYVQAARTAFDLRPADRVLQFSSLCFDVAAEEIFPILSCGGQLVLRRDALLESNAEFLTGCRQHGITVLSLPTAYWQQLIASDEGQQHWPDSLRLVVIGGEAVSLRHVEKWQQTLGRSCRLLNAYGPTEATISVTLHPLDTPDGRVAIGRPVANTRIYILDSYQKPLPPGIPGELGIAGAGLARGYLNRPEITAERFVSVPGLGRIYRTGDRARWRPDGALEFLGRIDDQVQLRGFRIEPAEIEAVLCGHPDVNAAVVVPEGSENVQRLLAYVTLHAPLADAGLALATWLRERLPDYMVPAAFVVLEKLPLTSTGKIDKHALPAPEFAAAGGRDFVPPQTRLEQQIAQIWREVLPRDRVGIHDNFFDLGGHSLLLIQVQSRLQAVVGSPVPPVTLFQFPTIHALAAHLTHAAPITADTAAPARPARGETEDVAIVGMAARFPGAPNLEVFWANLRQGIESIRFFTDEELLQAGVAPEQVRNPDYVKAHGALEGTEQFDAAFFGFTPAEAERLDPQERLFLETAYTALEHAGYDASRLDFPVGLYAGAGLSSYFLHHVLPRTPVANADFQTLIGGDKDFLATRAAYKLNLKGPAVTLHTACSTSLVAIHLARQSLLQGECTMALAGGVSLTFPQISGYLHQEGMITSPDGHCRAFDARANGTVGGSGVGVVVLKRLSRALADGDTVHAVIKGSAINNDGKAKVGYTAPGVDGQRAVIQAAMAGLDYESISYLEAHGTGTPMGDPIELEALTRAYRGGTQKTSYCALGSVKTNVGHLDTAAGVAGLLKTVLALKHREIPPSLHFSAPNPQIDFARSPFFVNSRLRTWDASAPRRAGVSSFGIGGTNAHVVVEEAPTRPPVVGTQSRKPVLFCLSARSEAGLREYRLNLAIALGSLAEADLAAAAFTLATGRQAFACRGAFVAATRAECVQILREAPADRFWQHTVADEHGAPGAAASTPIPSQAGGEVAGARFGAKGDDSRMTTWARQWLAGGVIDWNGFYASDSRRRLPLPTYPFERKRFWLDVRPPAGSAESRELADWFYVPVWQREKIILHSAPPGEPNGTWLVFLDRRGLGEPLAARLRAAGHGVVTVSPGTTFTRLDATAYTLDPNGPEDCDALLAELAAANRLPTTVVFLWGIDPEVRPRAFFLLLALARALWTQSATREFRFEVVTDQLHGITGTERIDPAQGALLGPVRVIPQEYPTIRCRCVDLELPHAIAESPLVEALLAQFHEPPVAGNRLVALRGAYRYEQRFVPEKLPATASPEAGLRRQGVYLITGGLGGVGMALARYLAETVQARLVLLGRSPVPPKERWAEILAQAPRSAPASGADAVGTALQTWAAAPDAAPSSDPDLDRAVDELCSGYSYGYFARALPAVTGTRWRRDELKARLRIQPKFDRLFSRMLAVLAEERLIRLAEHEVEFTGERTPPDVEALRQAIATRHPDFRGNLRLLDHCVAHYPAALSGEIDALSVLYPQGDNVLLAETGPAELPEAGEGHYLRRLRDLIAEILARGTKRKLRILEVGGGNGALVRALHGVLNRFNAEYHFTDVGNAFVVNARKRAEANGDGDWMRFSVLDISKPPEAQGFGTLRFDLILGFNVVHATADIATSLRHLQRLLLPHGLLCLVETVKRQRWVDLVWGLADGWWCFTDTELRRDSPLLSIAQWETVLAAQDYTDVHAFPRDPAERQSTEAALLLARAPAVSAPPTGSDPGALLRQVRALEACGSQVLVLSADVSDRAQMRAVHQQVRTAFGPVHGIVHAAGIEGGGTIGVGAAEMAGNEFAAKIIGTQVLEDVFLPERPDFFLLCSSHNSLLGGAGQVGYSAANAFLDTYAQARAGQPGTFTCSINWDRWQGIGMAAKVEATHRARSGEALTGGLTAAEGTAAFHRILARSSFPQVVVAKQNFLRTLDAIAAPANHGASGEVATEAAVRDAHRRPDLSNPFVAPRFKVEQSLAQAWEELLGISPIGVHDDFYELGGDSLLAMRVAARVRQALAVEVPVRDLLVRPTIAQLAEFIAAALVAPNDGEDAADYGQEEEL